MQSKQIFIYVLKDTISNDIRYVGKTVNPEKRLLNHINKANLRNYHSANWINSLLKKGLKPILEVIEICSEINWEEREIYWISYYSKLYDLTNINAGGGFGGNSLGFKGKHHSKESIDKMISSRLGKSINQRDTNGNRKRSIQNYCNSNKIKVYQYSLDGNFIKEWDSAVDAANELKVFHSNITAVCKGRKNICFNCKWSYSKVDKLVLIDEELESFKELINNKLNVSEIALHKNISVRTVFRKLKKFNLKIIKNYE